jgi:hypothetical protein
MSFRFEASFQGRRDPLRSLKTVSAIMALLQTAACIAYATALMAFRFQDQDLDPWNTAIFYYFAVSTTWFVPLLFTLNLWVNYKSSIAYTLQTIVCVGWAAWGFFHIVYMIVDWTDCNDMTGPNPDVPYCINRYFPTETIPDFSFYVLFISVCTSTAVTIFWLWFGSRLRLATSGLVKRLTAAAVSRDDDDLSIDSNYQSIKQSTDQKKFQQQDRNLLTHYNTYIASTIENALNDALEEQNSANNSSYVNPENGIKLNRAAAHIITNALLKASKSQKGNGDGIVDFHKFIGSSVPTIQSEIDAYYHGIRTSSKFPKNQHDLIAARNTYFSK